MTIFEENNEQERDKKRLYEGAAQENPVLLQYWQAILRHKIAIIVIIITAVILSVITTLLMTPHYTATSRIEINRTQDKVTNVEGVKSDDVGQNLEFYQTQYSLLEAHSLAERVVRQKNLASQESFFDLFGVDADNSGLIASNTNRMSAAERNKRQNLAAQILLENVSISPIRGSSLIDVSFNSPDPQFSSEIANTWVSEFIESNLDRRYDSTSDAREFLLERLAQLRQSLEESERKLVLYADNNEIVTLSSKQDSAGRTISNQTLASANLEALNTSLAKATAERIAAASEVQSNGTDKNSLANLALHGIREQRALAAAEYAKLLVQFEPEYPAAKALASQIADLDASIAREDARSRSGTIARYREALKSEQDLQRKVELLKAEFSGERRTSIQYNIYQREVDTNRQLYDGLLQRYKEIGVAGVGSNNISVVDRARAPERPSSPNVILNLLFGILAGLLVALGYVFVSEQVDQSIKDPSELKNKLGIAVLGSIPDLNKEDIITSLQDKKSQAWEAYLSIRTSLSFLTDHGVPRSFLMTSTRPNEGKSTSAFALSSVLASAGKRVLLVDGDMRNPSLHRMLGIENVAGLSNYLSGSNDMKNMIQNTAIENFHAMTAGPIPPNAAELLSSERMSDLVVLLGKEFDHIIVDAPPVLGLADIPLLSNSVEGVIYTVEANGVKMKGIESGLQRVRSSKAHIFGAIVTKVSTQQSGYGYGYDYQYSYGAKVEA